MDVRRPREIRWGNYRSLPEKIEFDRNGNAINPFRPGSSRYQCFEALRKGVSLEKFLAGVIDARAKNILAERFKQIERSFFRAD
jgi:hypothetical protein